MRRRTWAAAVAMLIAATPATSHAQFTLFANMTNDQENGVVNPTLQNGNPRPGSFGFASFLINAAMTQMTMSMTVYNIDFTGTQTADIFDNLTNAHIHGSSDPNFTPPANAGVIWGFIGTPFNDNSPTDVVVTPFASGVGGTVTAKWDKGEGNNTTFAAQLPNILAGRTYVNFHTTQFPGGEIRGAILLTPEPSISR